MARFYRQRKEETPAAAGQECCRRRIDINPTARSFPRDVVEALFVNAGGKVCEGTVVFGYPAGEEKKQGAGNVIPIGTAAFPRSPREPVDRKWLSGMCRSVGITLQQLLAFANPSVG